MGIKNWPIIGKFYYGMQSEGDAAQETDTLHENLEINVFESSPQSVKMMGHDFENNLHTENFDIEE